MDVSPSGQKLSAGSMSVSFSMLSSTLQRTCTLLENEDLDTEGENVRRPHLLTGNIYGGSAPGLRGDAGKTKGQGSLGQTGPSGHVGSRSGLQVPTSLRLGPIPCS